MKIERHIVYAQDDLVDSARDMGMANLSQFVREALKEYIKNGVIAGKANNPATTTNGGNHDVTV